MAATATALPRSIDDGLRNWYRPVPIGINLAMLTDYATELPFCDLMRGARWNAAGTAVTANHLGGHYPAGDYTATWSGTGSVAWSGGDVARAASLSANRQVVTVDPTKCKSIIATPSGDVSELALWMPGLEGFRWNPDFLASLGPFSVLRSMDWLQTNGSPIANWSDRPHVTDRTWFKVGVPLEVVCDLAMVTGKSPWLCVPVQASDDYATQLGALLRQYLPPWLVVRLEFSNEVWNGAFSQNAHCQQRGTAAGLSADPNRAGLMWYAQRAAQVFGLVAAGRGGGGSIQRVAGSQFANTWTTGVILDAAPGAFDALAVGAYFGAKLGQAANAAATRALGLDGLMAALAAEVSGPHTDAIGAQLAVAQAHGVGLVAYEGGQHLVGVGSAIDDPDLLALFQAANRDPRMGELYRAQADAWRAAGAGLFTYYTDCELPTKYGSWGVREHLGDTSGPKATAVAAIAAGR